MPSVAKKGGGSVRGGDAVAASEFDAAHAAWWANKVRTDAGGSTYRRGTAAARATTAITHTRAVQRAQVAARAAYARSVPTSESPVPPRVPPVSDAARRAAAARSWWLAAATALVCPVAAPALLLSGVWRDRRGHSVRAHP